MSNQAQLFSPPDVVYAPREKIFFRNVIEDRGSKYSVLCVTVDGAADPKKWAKEYHQRLSKNKFFNHATHNSYAWRYEGDNGFVDEGYNDDGEKGAGLCILREMRKSCLLNGLIVVTRYYGGVELQGDRFRYVIDATKLILEKI